MNRLKFLLVNCILAFFDNLLTFIKHCILRIFVDPFPFPGKPSHLIGNSRCYRYYNKQAYDFFYHGNILSNKILMPEQPNTRSLPKNHISYMLIIVWVVLSLLYSAVNFRK